MLGLLARVVIGVVIGAGATYGIYKLVTRDTLKEEVYHNLNNESWDVLERAFAAKIKEKSNETITVDIMDEWDEPLTDMDIHGDEIASDIRVGDVILL